MASATDLKDHPAMNIHPVERFVDVLLEKWSAEETVYRRRGQNGLADFLASLMKDAIDERDRFLDEALTLAEAAEICGYSYSRLENLVRLGELSNAGERGRPRVRRRDLPRKTSGTLSDRDVRPTLHRTNRKSSVDDLIEAELLAMEAQGLP